MESPAREASREFVARLRHHFCPQKDEECCSLAGKMEYLIFVQSGDSAPLLYRFLQQSSCTDPIRRWRNEQSVPAGGGELLFRSILHTVGWQCNGMRGQPSIRVLHWLAVKSFCEGKNYRPEFNIYRIYRWPGNSICTEANLQRSRRTRLLMPCRSSAALCRVASQILLAGGRPLHQTNWPDHRIIKQIDLNRDGQFLDEDTHSLPDTVGHILYTDTLVEDTFEFDFVDSAPIGQSLADEDDEGEKVVRNRAEGWWANYILNEHGTIITVSTVASQWTSVQERRQDIGMRIIFCFDLVLLLLLTETVLFTASTASWAIA